MTDLVQVTTTVDSAHAAAELAQSVVSARLAACAQVLGPISSVYWWQDALQHDHEHQIVFKTTLARYPALEAHLRAEHSYEEPEIVAVPIITGSAGYLAWIENETQASRVDPLR